MKKIIVVLGVLFFASPVLAQDYQPNKLLQPYEIYQLDESPQPDQSIKYFQPYQFELQQPQVSKPKAAKHSSRHINTDLPEPPADTK